MDNLDIQIALMVRYQHIMMVILWQIVINLLRKKVDS